MELGLRIVVAIVSLITFVLNTIQNWILPRRAPTYPPIRNKLLTKSVGELIVELRQRKLTSEELTQAYITRIQEVNPTINAVIEDRFAEALKEAEHADQLIAKSTNEQLVALFARYPLLGIPFTVKESCGVKGLSFVVGSTFRTQKKCDQDGEIVELLRAAGCIPLLVSATPEFCLSFETNSHTNGRCLNPYDLRRVSAGSSGGEGALVGSGASLFGVGSDIAGSIRLPSMFCGVFGHKPTGGLVSVKGHFPNNATDPEYPICLQMGPITRFGKDIPLLLQVMAGKNAEKLKFGEGVQTKDIKIYYTYGFEGIYRIPVAFDIKLSIKRAVKCFKQGGLTTKEVEIKHFKNSFELCIAGLMRVKNIPSIATQSAKTRPSSNVLLLEFFRSLFGHSVYTKEALFLELLMSVNAFMAEETLKKYEVEIEELKEELLLLLGTDGVLFLPTYHVPATFFSMSIPNFVGVDFMLLFNVLGFPATHIPMGLDHRGLPIGFQVVAAPYQDKLCLQIAAELEGAFGGWLPPLPHELVD